MNEETVAVQDLPGVAIHLRRGKVGWLNMGIITVSVNKKRGEK